MGVVVEDAGGVRFVGQRPFLPVLSLGTLVFRPVPAVHAAGENRPINYPPGKLGSARTGAEAKSVHS